MARYAADAWQASELGVPAARGRGAVSFAEIDPAVAARGCQTLGPAAARDRLRVQHDPLRSGRVQAVLPLPRRVHATGAGSRPGRPAADGALPRLAGPVAVGRVHQDAVAGIRTGLS